MFLKVALGTHSFIVLFKVLFPFHWLLSILFPCRHMIICFHTFALSQTKSTLSKFLKAKKKKFSLRTGILKKWDKDKMYLCASQKSKSLALFGNMRHCTKNFRSPSSWPKHSKLPINVDAKLTKTFKLKVKFFFTRLWNKVWHWQHGL